MNKKHISLWMLGLTITVFISMGIALLLADVPEPRMLEAGSVLDKMYIK